MDEPISPPCPGPATGSQGRLLHPGHWARYYFTTRCLAVPQGATLTRHAYRLYVCCPAAMHDWGTRYCAWHHRMMFYTHASCTTTFPFCLPATPPVRPSLPTFYGPPCGRPHGHARRVPAGCGTLCGIHHAVRCHGSQNGHDAFPQAAVHSAVHHAVRCYGPSPCGSRHGHDEFPQAAIHSLGGTSCSTLLCTAALWQPARTRRVSAGCDQGAGNVEDGGRGGGGAKGDLLACKVGGGGIIRRAWRVAWQHTQEGGGVAH